MVQNNTNARSFRIYGSAVLFFLVAISHGQAQMTSLRPFLDHLDSERTQLKIPALGVALQRGDSVLFLGAFGYADLEKKIKADANTSFRIASITKTLTSTLVMQLVRQGKLSLDAPAINYGVDLGNAAITVGQLLTHTSEGTPGTHYQYNGYRFGRLGPLLEKVTGVPFDQLIMDSIIRPAGMRSTAPGISGYEAFGLVKKRKDLLPYFENAYTHLARAYYLNDKGEVTLGAYGDEFGAFGGLVTTPADLLKYSAAIDRHRFLPATLQAQVFAPNRTATGEVTPYGLGWFTQTFHGLHYYWHYGQTPGESGLFIKVPEKKITLVVLANTDKLSTPFPLGDGDLLTSPVGQLLYQYIIAPDSLVAGADKDFYNKMLVARASIALVQGDTAQAKVIYAEYADRNFKKAPSNTTADPIAAIEQAGINKTLSTGFTLQQATTIAITGVGENCSADFSVWCDYGWIEDAAGKTIWQMQGQPATHAGGAIKNQRVEATITLPAGRYTLHYKSDSGHAFNNWDSAPPDHFVWGIVLSRL